MVRRYTTNNTFVTKQEEEEADISPEYSCGSPVSASSKIRKLISSPLSTKKSSKRSMDKRVVTIPIMEVEACRLKGETTPPSDSWAWRKYGQKPIKGSPYPRGYYRCSGSKGCPARKQVERSHLDPTVLLVTYSSEHNHPLPSSSSRNHHRHHHDSSAAASAKHDDDNTAIDLVGKSSDDDDTSKTADETNEEHKFGDLDEDSLLTDGWFAGMESTTSSTRLLESPLFMEMGETNLGEMMVMQEEEESLFADLGELPECSIVFRRSTAADKWCGAATL